MTDITLEERPVANPCRLVRNSCMGYVQTDASRSFVTINQDAIPNLAETIRQQQKQTKQVVEWDEENWHYRCEQNECTDEQATAWPQSIRKERIALYILALDAINFSFWTNEDNRNGVKYEYEDLAVTLTNMAQSDHLYQHQVVRDSLTSNNGTVPLSSQYIFSPSSLQHMTVDRMTCLFQAHHARGWVPPNLQERCQIWNEIGQVLHQAPFQGSILSLLDMAHQSAPGLVQLLIDYFPNFRDDTATHNENSRYRPVVPLSSQLPPLYFYKRAQICVGDWNAAFSAQGISLNLIDMDQITTFADYRVPQLLRHFDVLRYSMQLSKQIDHGLELFPYSYEELAIRASTVAAVELLVEQLQQKHHAENCFDLLKSEDTETTFCWNAMQTDWYLWQVGERMNQSNELKPHHRVRTTFY